MQTFIGLHSYSAWAFSSAWLPLCIVGLAFGLWVMTSCNLEYTFTSFAWEALAAELKRIKALVIPNLNNRGRIMNAAGKWGSSSLRRSSFLLSCGVHRLSLRTTPRWVTSVFCSSCHFESWEVPSMKPPTWRRWFSHLNEKMTTSITRSLVSKLITETWELKQQSVYYRYLLFFLANLLKFRQPFQMLSLYILKLKILFDSWQTGV